MPPVVRQDAVGVVEEVVVARRGHDLDALERGDEADDFGLVHW